MLIGEVSRITGLSKDTIRWYDKIGLINQGSSGRTTGNYRTFDQETLRLLKLIKQIKALGFTIREIKEILSSRKNDGLDCDSLEVSIQKKVQMMEEEINLLKEKRSRLLFIAQNCNGDCQASISEASW